MNREALTIIGQAWQTLGGARWDGRIFLLPNVEYSPTATIAVKCCKLYFTSSTAQFSIRRTTKYGSVENDLFPCKIQFAALHKTSSVNNRRSKTQRKIDDHNYKTRLMKTILRVVRTGCNPVLTCFSPHIPR